MTIAFIHTSFDQPWPSGVTRYGQLIAQAFAEDGADVIDVNAVFTNDQAKNAALLRDCLGKCQSASTILIQYSPVIWEKISLAALVAAFWRRGRSPMIVTVHDSLYMDYPPQILRLMREVRARGLRETGAQLQRLLTSMLKFLIIATNATNLVVHSAIEIEKLKYVPLARKKIKVIPHFVESRTEAMPTNETAKQKLGLQGRLVICLLGFIFFRKGHDVLLKAATALPAETMIVFAGGHAPGGERYVEGRLELAEALGIREQVRVTGFLSDEDQALYMAATDIAVLPFHRMAASGSLSTWISAGHPLILANDLQQIAEYNTIAPGAILTFAPFTSEALGKELLHLSSTLPSAQNNPSVRHLQEELSMSKTLERYRQVYE